MKPLKKEGVDSFQLKDQMGKVLTDVKKREVPFFDEPEEESNLE